MAQSADSFNVVGLDFSDAKASLKTFLQSQNTLKDYNFDGSVLSTILDVLAYNTHYQGFYANMVANEMFLDSAVLRPSIASHAKQLGYTPQSYRSAKATLTIPITAGSVNTNTYLARGTEFTGTDTQGSQYRFMLLDNVYADVSTGSFVGVDVYEGSLRKITYVYDPNRKESSVLLIPNDKIDTTTIRIRVQSSVTDTSGATDTWSLAESYINLTPTSKVYFLQEREMGMYELYFGDNFLGMQPKSGNVVSIEYMETNGSVGNEITTFTHSVGNLGTPVVTSASAGGGEPESSTRIKFLAPKYYKSQHRAVTENDYKATIFREYPNASSVYVYGGETTTPPQYGKVFIAVKPKSGSSLSESEKASLLNTLKTTYSVVGIIPEITDTDYIDLVVDSKITYNPASINISSGTLKAVAVAYAFSYSNNQLNGFGSNFYYSKFVQGLNSIHSSILSNQTKVKMRKTISVSTLIAYRGFTINFKNPIYHPHPMHSVSVISSNLFPHKDFDGTTIYSCSLRDTGSGSMDVIKMEADGMETPVYSGVGTVDYENGTVTLNSKFAPVIPTGLEYAITVTAEPHTQDLFVYENRIFRINRGYPDSVNISLEPRSVV
jgi:hypothetical protein